MVDSQFLIFIDSGEEEEVLNQYLDIVIDCMMLSTLKFNPNKTAKRVVFWRGLNNQVCSLGVLLEPYLAQEV